jgi:FMN phosphatase YigB (HAD superfamily)
VSGYWGDTDADARGRFRTGGDSPVVALDIDGTLGNYHRHFLWFAELYFGRDFPRPDEVNPGRRLSEFMGIPHHEYQQCKLAYRQGGMKRCMPYYPGASQLTQQIRAAGAKVWICTTRPYLRLDNIDPDTREWLRRSRIRYDAVIFDSPLSGDHGVGKYEDLVNQVGTDRIVAAVDDLPEQIDLAKSAGIKTLYIRDQPYNRYREIPAIRVHDLNSLAVFLLRDIHQWKADHE